MINNQKSLKTNVIAFKQLLETAAGNGVLDLIIDNVKLVDVYTGEIRPASIGIYGEYIVAVSDSIELPSKKRIDGCGRYATPGFIDSHIHIETTLLTPEELGAAIVPWGTTTLMVDAMEIANVAGADGLLSMTQNTNSLPFRIYLEIPSRVPTAPGLETTGGVIDENEVNKLLSFPECVSLGELDPSKVMPPKEPYLAKILIALAAGKICNGHAIGLNANELNVYATAHLSDDHECVTYQELLDRLHVGISVFIREGSSERNARELLKGIVDNNLPTDNIMFCTDDKHVNDIIHEGHISYNIQTAIDLGMSPVEAIQIATINAARHFRMADKIGSITPGRFADILLIDDLNFIKPSLVLKSGKEVFSSKHDHISTVKSKSYPDYLFHTVVLPAQINEKSFSLQADGQKAHCHIISLIPNQIINTASDAWLPIVNGQVMPDTERDLCKLSVVERYGKNGRVANAFVKGFGIKNGALAASVSHDHHNIVVVGDNNADMLIAVKELERVQGGFTCVLNGKIQHTLPLPLGGLMSTQSATEVMSEMDRLNNVTRALGVTMAAPFMTLSFISLPTVPELGLTDYGLIDVKGHKTIPIIIETQK